ncbi:MAG: hypothetical protein QOF93_923 [Verrucomicrobiota bacterium]
MQRVTRGIYAELASRTSVTAICWNRLDNCYHLLGEPELTYLLAPFSKYTSAVGRPDLRGEKLPSELRRCLRRKRLELTPELKQGKTLLVPDIYFDERTRLLPDALTESTGRSVAIFHDAANLRLSLFSLSAAAAFRKYIRSLAAFDHVICISEQSQIELLELWHQCGIENPPSTSVEVWPLGFERRDQNLASSNGATKVILCVGSFEPRKNHLSLLQAAEHLWSLGLKFDLRLIGRSTGGSGYKVLYRIRWLQAKGRRVSWLKHVDDSTLLEAYRKCHFTVYPSLAEGFGLPIMESLSHGKPCICGSNGALGEIARGGGCVLIDQASIAELARAMHLLLTDQEIYNTLSKRARERRFRCWGEYTTSLLDCLSDEESTREVPNVCSLGSDGPTIASEDLGIGHAETTQIFSEGTLQKIAKVPRST